MMLKGNGLKGTMRLIQDNGRLNASVLVPDLQGSNKPHPVYVFYNEEKAEKIGVLKAGDLQASLQPKGTIKAAGIMEDTEGMQLIMTGETEDFDWDHAKSMLYFKNQGSIKTALPEPEASIQENKTVPFEIGDNQTEPEPNIFPINDIFPLTEEPEYSPKEDEFIENLLKESGYLEESTENPPQAAEEVNMNAENATETENEFLRKARQPFELPQEQVCEQCPIHAKKTIVRPFSKQYLEFEWEKTEYPGLKGYWHYITGRLYVDGVLQKIAIGVPGDYAINPPSWLYGFDTYAFADGGDARGYWILFEDA